MNKCENKIKYIFKKKKRIVVIGDLHGDWQMTKNLFIKLGLIDLNQKWIAEPKDTIVVQLGDQLDGKGRVGPDAYGEMQILDFLEEVHEQAEFYNGGIYSLLGNHEMMNINCNFSYVSNKEMSKNRCSNFQPGGPLAKRLACTRNLILKIGDFVFVHAGILPKHFNNFKNSDNFIKKINESIRDYLLNNNLNDNILNLAYNDNDSMLWTRKYNQPSICDDISKVKKFFKMKSIIVGHSVQEKINSKCKKNIWMVDVGLSKSMGGKKTQVLEIWDNGEKLQTNNYKPFKIIDL